MTQVLTNLHNPAKNHCVCVPNTIKMATVELLTARGAPVFIGTELAILQFDNITITLRSKISGVVDRVLVDNNQLVHSNQELFELRNVNIIRGRAGNKMQPAPSPTPKPTAEHRKSPDKNPRKPIPLAFFPSRIEPAKAAKHTFRKVTQPRHSTTKQPQKNSQIQTLNKTSISKKSIFYFSRLKYLAMTFSTRHRNRFQEMVNRPPSTEKNHHALRSTSK